MKEIMAEELVEQIPTTEELFAKCYIGSGERVGGELSEKERSRVQTILKLQPPLGHVGIVSLSRVEPTLEQPKGELRTVTTFVPAIRIFESSDYDD